MISVALRRAFFLVSTLIALIAVGPAAATRGNHQNLGQTRMTLGQVYTITGRTANRVDGAVVLSGRWHGDRWKIIIRTTTHGDGTYRVVLKPRRRGQLELRLSTPDDRVQRVVLTVT
jgi:hypothetical protein